MLQRLPNQLTQDTKLSAILPTGHFTGENWVNEWSTQSVNLLIVNSVQFYSSLLVKLLTWNIFQTHTSKTNMNISAKFLHATKTNQLIYHRLLI
jgi:hypothetical protein